MPGLFDGARKFYETKVHGKVSDATILGYLRAGTQIENIWTQIDSRVDELIAKGMPPWEAYAQLKYALAFVRSARAYVVFVQEMINAEEAAHPTDKGFVSRVVFDQADALCKQVQPNLNSALAALNDPKFVPNVSLPFELGPRIEYDPCPLSHLQGLINAAREMQSWAAGLLAKYENTMTGLTEVPTQVTEHINTLHGTLAQADFQLGFGVDLVGQVSPQSTTFELQEQAEDALWNAMQGYFRINQVVADPALGQRKSVVAGSYTGSAAGMSSQQQYHNKRVSMDDLWGLLASDSARRDYEEQKQRGVNPYREPGPGEPVNLGLEMRELHEKLHGELPARALQFLDEIQAAVVRGDAEVFSSWAECPYDPVYRAKADLTLVGERVPNGYEFHFNIHDHNYQGGIQMERQFSRRTSWDEELEDDK